MWQALVDLIKSGLEFFGETAGNYGVGIILLTVVFRMLLLPLTYSQNRATRKMQELNPELKKLQKKYENDSQKLNEETMKLWQEHNVNPAAGCLPMLVQMPIFFAMITAFRQFEFSAEAGFLWMPTLAQPDPIYLLPILAGVATFLQTRIGTASMDQAGGGSQAMMMYGMPFLIGYISSRFPAGVALYWTVTNIFGVGQQYVVNFLLEREENAGTQEGAD